MIDTSKYDGHTTTHWSARNLQDGSPESCDEDYEHDEPFIETETETWVHTPAIGYLVGADGHSMEEQRANMRLMADAPLLLEEIKRLRKEINQLPIDLHESLDMILEAHYPEVRESVMSMFGDAWGNNLTGYEE